jgi:hypothetical protein
VALLFEGAAGTVDALLDGGDDLEGIVLVPSAESGVSCDTFCGSLKLGAREVKHLPWVRIVLLEFNLMRRHGLAVAVKDQKAGAGGSLIN